MNAQVITFKLSNGLPLNADETKALIASLGESAKAETPAKSGKVGSTKEFNREDYERIARKCGCYGKHGVWKAARPTIYAVMDGRMRESDAKKAIKAIADRNGWTLNTK